MNASYRLNKLLSNPRRQQQCGWLDKIANRTNFTKFITSWKFPLLLIGGLLGAVEIGTYFNIMDTIFNILLPPLVVMAACCFLQLIHIERVEVISESHRHSLVEKLNQLKHIGVHDDQGFVLSIAQMLKRDEFEHYHGFWWNSVGLALAARLEELNSVHIVAVNVDVDTQLECLHNPLPNKKLKV